MAEPSNGTLNGSKEESEPPETAPVLSAKEKVVNEASEDTKESEESANGIDTPAEKPSVATSVSVIKSVQDPEDSSTEVPESAKEAPSCTVADLIEEEEEESPKEEEEETEKVEEKSDEKEPTADTEMTVDEENKASEEESVEKEAEAMEEEEKLEDAKEDAKEDARSVKQDTKSAAELAYEWDDDGIEDEKPSPAKTPKKKSESKPKAPPVVDVTPGRKSSRTPKPTQRKLESESQKNLKPEEEEEEEDGDEEDVEEDEESVDAIAKELEKSDSDTKTSPGSGKKGSAKKGKKPVSEEKSKEEWVNLIFGENGEKVTEKGVKGTEKGGKCGKTGDAKESKGEEEGPDEEFLPDDTPKAKKGGRPKKKGLDETLDGVAKLGSNMYFYTGPGGSDSPPPLDSDEEDLPIKKADSEPARKSSRANKGRNTRLERGDEVVDIPQVKEAPKPNLNPSWLKNHDSKNSPAKKGATPVVKPVEKEEKKKEEKKKEVKKEDKEEKIEEKVEEEEDKVEDEKVDEAEVEKEEPMDTIE